MILFIILIIMMIIFIVDANYNHSCMRCMREITSQIQSINNKIQEIEKKIS